MSTPASAPSEMAFFSLLARCGSFSATARELDVTTPAVSKRLAQMEARLGAQLLNRTTRRVSLTPEGELYLGHARRILADIEDMEQRVASAVAAPKGLLRVNATLGFGRTHIAPLISGFAKIHPEVQIQLQLTVNPPPADDDAFDVVKGVLVSGGGLTVSCSCTCTWGWSLAKLVISGAMWLRPKPSVALTRNRPLGAATAPLTRLLHVVDIGQDAPRVLQEISPSGVRPMRRVVRCSSGTPRRASIWVRRLLTAGVLMSSSRAAADRLPQRASRLKKAISEGAVAGCWRHC